ncbi:MAG: S9 family peptidase [Gemmatimonadetes bacterium]|nr:MAG: S9 family peptidase [Gemmatimonadota bacterium]
MAIMHARPLRRLCLVVVAVLHPAPLVAQGVQAPALTVHSIWGTREFASDLVSLTWMKDGTAYTTTQTDSAGHTDLYRVDALSGKTQLLLRGTELVPPGAQQPIAIEEYRFSTDGMRLLIFTNSARVWRQNTKGTYYVWDFTAKRLIPVSAKPGYQMFAKFSPDGRMVAFVRANNIYMTDLATGGETALTADGGDSVINGTSDWVYEEELDLRDAFRWSPDGRRIAFWRFDQTAIPTFYLLDADSLYPQLVPVRYPKAGMPNSEVKIGVVDVGTRQTTWVDLGGDKDIYVAAMDFAGSSNEIWLTRLNRHQDRLDLLLADAQRGASRVIMTDRDSAWVDANQPRWINGGKQFLFVSERDGYDQVYLFNRDGSLVRRVTPGGWDVLQVYGVDEKKQVLYCGGAIDGPLGRPLVRIGLDGKGLARISTEPGTHGIEFDPTFQLYVDTYSRTGIPPVQTLRRADGRLVRTLADNAALAAKVTALGLVRPEFITLKTPDGVELNAWIIKPKGFDPSRRYPLLMNVYGGPGSQTVTDSWGGANYLWHQMLARDGYLVASVDNRGTGGRGARFMKLTYLHLGRYESADQIASARWFAAQPYVDPDRIGIWGWSYGGYMSSLSMFRGGGVFKAALAVAPVTDWRFYDTIYTERYMRTPQENPAGYGEGAPLAYADSLKGHFLLVHGTGDDNVHFQNSVRLVERLEAANKQFDMRIYPNKTHSIAGGSTRENLYGLFTAWLEQNL